MTICVSLLVVLLLFTCYEGIHGESSDDVHIVVSSLPSPSSTISTAETVINTLTITIVPSVSVDVQIEISGRDEINSITSFAIWEESAVDAVGLTVEKAGDPVSRASVAEPVYDGLHYDFGTVTNSANENQTMTLSIGAAFVKDSYNVDDNGINLYFGGDYSNGAFVWSDIISFNIDNSEEVTPSYNITQSCDPDTLEIDYFSICKANLTTSDKFASAVEIKVEILNKDELAFPSYAVPNLREIGRSGRHIPVPPSFALTYSSTKEMSYVVMSKLTSGKVIKADGEGSIMVEFALGTYKDNSRAGQTLNVKISIISDDVTFGESIFNVSIVETTRALSPLEVNMITITMVNQSVDGFTVISNSGDRVYYDILFNLTGKSASEKFDAYLNMEVSHPGLVLGKASVKSRGFNCRHVHGQEIREGFISFGTLLNTEQMDGPNTAYIKYRLWFTLSGDDETSAFASFTLRDGTPISATGTALLKRASHTTVVTSDFEDFEVSKLDNYLEGNRASKLTLGLGLKNGTLYRDIKVAIYPEAGSPDVPIRMCSAYVSHIGNNMPSTHRMHIMDSSKHFDKRFNTSYYADVATFYVGDVATNSLEYDSLKNKILISFLLTPPWGMPNKDYPPGYEHLGIYKYSVSVEVGGELIATDVEEFTLHNGLLRHSGPRVIHASSNPTIKLSAYRTDVLRENSPYKVLALIKIGPYMTHDLDLLIEPPVGVQLCHLSLQQRGNDVACVQGGDWYRGERFTWHNSSRLFYEKREDGVTNARLTILGITNAGSEKLDDKTKNETSVYINIYLMTLPGFTGGTLKASLQEVVAIGGTLLAESSFILGVPSSALANPVPTGTTLTFTVVPAKFAVYAAGVFEVSLTIPEDVSHSMTVTITTTPNAAYLCSAHVTFVGALMPCVNGTLAGFTYNSNSATVHLGQICRTEQRLVSDYFDVDIIRIRFAFIPSNPSLALLQFTGDVSYDGVPQNLGVTSPGIAPATIATLNDSASYSVSEAWFNASTLTVKDTVPVFVNISVPRGVTLPFQAVLLSSPDVDVGRPSFILSNVRIAYAGKNVECSLTANDYMNVVLNSTRDEGDNDTAVIDIASISNTAFTELTYNDSPDDDVFTLAVDAMLNDAEGNDNLATVSIEVQVSAGVHATTFSRLASITVYRDVIEDLQPSLNYSITHDFSDYYNSGDVASVVFRMKHFETSMAEPINVRLVMYLPYRGYLDFTANETSGRLVDITIADMTTLTTSYRRLKFHEETEVVYHFTINPNNRRDFGVRPYQMIVPYTFIMCIPPRHPVSSTILYEAFQEGCFQPQRSHYVVKMQDKTCATSLRLTNSDVFPDCLFDASSILDGQHSPSNSRINSIVPWSPRMSEGAEWLQIDLVNYHIITDLQHQPHVDYLQARDLTIKVSEDGFKWTKVEQLVLPQDTGIYDHSFATLPSARYVRFYITSSYGSGKPIGFRFNLYGCNVTNNLNVSDACTTTSTPLREDESGRSFAVDTVNNVAYFCDYISGRTFKTCFSSGDYGATWKHAPWFISELEGFRPDVNTIFASSSQSNSIFFTNDMGSSWAPTTKEELDQAKASSSWVPSSLLNYFGSISVTRGAWSANGNGVLYDNQLRASWSTCCSAKVP